MTGDAEHGGRHPLTARIVETFLTGHLTPLLMALSLLAGVAALLLTPREEEPQIVVPVADVICQVPGASAEEVERVVATRLEQVLMQIDGVEYVYSNSRADRAVVTVRFFVGEDREDSLVKLHNRLQMHKDLIPPQVSGWVVKPVEVDDVPILAVGLYSTEYGEFELRRMAEELERQVQGVKNTGRTLVVGGQPRRLIVRIDPEALAARQLGAGQLAQALRGATSGAATGTLVRDGVLSISTATIDASVDSIRKLVVGVHDGVPVLLRDVARIVDGPAERQSYTRIGFGRGLDREAGRGPAREAGRASDGDPDSGIGAGVPAALADPSRDYAMVTLAVAKQKGANAVWVSRAVQERIAELRHTMLPDDVHLRVIRDYGKTADHKVDELLEGLMVAIVIVIALLAVVLGWREALIVAAAVPLTFALTLLVNYLTGYTINRVTMFALILALGLVVDDPIVDVENIHRHLRRGDKSAFRAVLDAVNEVRPPIILATLAVMVSFLPMFFITGMMGPYMGPMALNVPLAMLMSLLVAFTVTPWLSLVMLKPHETIAGAGATGTGATGAGTTGAGATGAGAAGAGAAGAGTTGTAEGVFDDRAEEESAQSIHRAYRVIMRPLLRSRVWRYAALAVTALLFALSGWLALDRQVPLKMLPFDNKDELQVVIDMPEGTALEQTEAVAAEMAARLRGFAEVTDVSSFVGTASPMDFNGMVRQYYMRRGSELADLRVNLLPKTARGAQSHDIGIRFRAALREIATRHGADVKIVESPPGPPVTATLTVEFYGPEYTPYRELQRAASTLAERLRRETGVEDVDTTVPAEQRRMRFRVDRDKAALHGVSEAHVARLLELSTNGTTVATLHTGREANPLAVELRLPRPRRSSVADLLRLPVPVAGGDQVVLSEIGEFDEGTVDHAIFRKNMRRVAYVFADVAGRPPADVILDVQADRVAAGEPLPAERPAPGEHAVPVERPVPVESRNFLANGAGIPWQVPADIAVVWNGEGEWKITLDAFRDLGLAFFAACFGIYLLLVHETKSYLMPLILMLAIPFTIIGIMPGFWMLNLISGGEVGGVATPVFFTATAMIGMIALAGIAVRNSILLIEFVHRAEERGVSVQDAVLSAGAARFRPILLTAGTAMLAALPITADPIFSGLAWALIFGLLVSSAFTLVLVPMVYFMVYARRSRR